MLHTPHHMHIKIRWTCKIVPGNNRISAHLPLIASWNRQQGLAMPHYFHKEPVTQTYTAPHFIKTLGWDTHAKEWNANLSVLTKSVALLSRIIAKSWQENTEGQTIELTLCIVHDII
jgi:hypothetical protein